MSEELKTKARRIWEELFPKGDLNGLSDVIAENSIDHSARPDELWANQDIKSRFLGL